MKIKHILPILLLPASLFAQVGLTEFTGPAFDLDDTETTGLDWMTSIEVTFQNANDVFDEIDLEFSNYVTTDNFILADDGETTPGEIPQAQDSRLQGVNASTNTYELETGTEVVLSNDSSVDLGATYLYIDPTQNIDLEMPASGTFKRLENISSSNTITIQESDSDQRIIQPNQVVFAFYNHGQDAWEYSVVRSTDLVVNSKSAAYTVGADNEDELYGGVIYVTSTATITLPPVAEGQFFTIETIGAVAVTINPDDADLIYLDGTALDDGDSILNGSTAGDTASIKYFGASGWSASTNAWTDNG